MVVVGNIQKVIFDVVSPNEWYHRMFFPLPPAIHFEQRCFFTPTMVEVPQDLKPFLSNQN